jgi:hypothetical protein
MKRTVVIIDKTFGVFLGAYQNLAIFSKNDSFGIPRAAGFDSELAAESYALKNMPQYSNNMFYASVQSKLEYPDAIEIIKAGYGEHLGRMFDTIPMISTEIH